MAAGEWGSFANPGDVPGDQRLDSFGSLEFDTGPLAERIEILGNTRAILELSRAIGRTPSSPCDSSTWRRTAPRHASRAGFST